MPTAAIPAATSQLVVVMGEAVVIVETTAASAMTKQSPTRFSFWPRSGVSPLNHDDIDPAPPRF
jgi:hypothetical protein